MTNATDFTIALESCFTLTLITQTIICFFTNCIYIASVLTTFAFIYSPWGPFQFKPIKRCSVICGEFYSEFIGENSSTIIPTTFYYVVYRIVAILIKIIIIYFTIRLIGINFILFNIVTHLFKRMFLCLNLHIIPFTCLWFKITVDT